MKNPKPSRAAVRLEFNRLRRLLLDIVRVHKTCRIPEVKDAAVQMSGQIEETSYAS